LNEDDAVTYPPRDYRFWLVFLALDLSTLLTALELVGSPSILFRILIVSYEVNDIPRIAYNRS
jgi:hypothetical protein